MYTQPEVSRMAKALAKEFAKHNIKLTHGQAMELVARLHGSRNLATHQARARSKAPDAAALARDHAVSLMFVTTGRYGANVENFFDELEHAHALQDPTDRQRALDCVFDGRDGPVLRKHVRDEASLADLRHAFERSVAESLRLVDRTLFEARTLASGSPEVLFQGPLVDWRVQEGTPLEELPPEAQRRFEGRVARSGSQLYVDISLPHGAPEDIDGTDQLSLFIEINEGKPCVHVTNHLYGDQALTLFGSAEGVYLRFDTQTGQDFQPGSAFAREVDAHVLVDPSLP